MRLRQVEGAWVRGDSIGVRKVDIEGSSCAGAFAFAFAVANETLDLLYSFHLKQDHFFD